MNLVFVGMPISGSVRWETSVAWQLMEEGKKIGKYSFITCRVGGMGLSVSRSMITHMALKSGAGRSLQIDSDNVFGAAHLERILSHDEPFVGGMYPKKSIDFGWVGNFTGEPIRDDGLAPAHDFGGGFSLCNLNAVEKLCHPELQFESEHEITLSGEVVVKRGELVHDLWSTGPVRTKFRGRDVTRHLTEDYYFCHRATQAGFPVFMDTLCQLGHIGPVDYLQVWLKFQALERENAQLRGCIGAMSESSPGRPESKDPAKA